MDASRTPLKGVMLVTLGLAIAACSGTNVAEPSQAQPEAPGDSSEPQPTEIPSAPASAEPTGGAFDGDWIFTNPEVVVAEFTICEAGCIELFGSQSNLLGEGGTLEVSNAGVQMNGVLWSINCTGGGGMSHNFDMFLAADGPDRLVANEVMMPDGGCMGAGPATVTFVAVRDSD